MSRDLFPDKEKCLVDFVHSDLSDLLLDSGGEEVPESCAASLLSIAKDAAEHVPAYKEFLFELGINRTSLQFSQV